MPDYIDRTLPITSDKPHEVNYLEPASNVKPEVKQSNIPAQTLDALYGEPEEFIQIIQPKRLEIDLGGIKRASLASGNLSTYIQPLPNRVQLEPPDIDSHVQFIPEEMVITNLVGGYAAQQTPQFTAENKKTYTLKAMRAESSTNSEQDQAENLYKEMYDFENKLRTAE